MLGFRQSITPRTSGGFIFISAPRRGRQRAFTRADLLATVACLALLALMALPAIGDNRAAGKSVLCLANLRQLALAFDLYAQENNDVFVENYTGGDALGGTAGRDPRKSPWATGWQDWGTGSDNTNISLIRDRRFARLAPYIRSEGNVHKCPADVFLSGQQRQRGWKERLRSVSMNATIGGGNAIVGPWAAEYLQMRSLRDLAASRISAERLMTFVDEHPDSINDPMLYPPTNEWIDVPGSLHNGAGSIAFADGHVELHPWKTNVRKVRVRITDLAKITLLPDDPDVAWFRAHSARR